MLLSYSIKDIKIQVRRITNSNFLSWIYQSLNGELPLRTSVLFAAFCSFVAFAHVGQKCSNLFSLASMSKFMNPNFSHIFGCMIGAKNKYIGNYDIYCVLLRIVVGLDSGCVKSWLLLTCQNLCQSHYFGAWHQHWPTKKKIGFTKDFCRGEPTFSIFEPVKNYKFYFINSSYLF